MSENRKWTYCAISSSHEDSNGIIGYIYIYIYNQLDMIYGCVYDVRDKTKKNIDYWSTAIEVWY